MTKIRTAVATKMAHVFMGLERPLLKEAAVDAAVGIAEGYPDPEHDEVLTAAHDWWLEDTKVAAGSPPDEADAALKAAREWEIEMLRATTEAQVKIAALRVAIKAKAEALFR